MGTSACKRQASAARQLSPHPRRDVSGRRQGTRQVPPLHGASDRRRRGPGRSNITHNKRRRPRVASRERAYSKRASKSVSKTLGPYAVLSFQRLVSRLDYGVASHESSPALRSVTDRYIGHHRGYPRPLHTYAYQPLPPPPHPHPSLARLFPISAI